MKAATTAGLLCLAVVAVVTLRMLAVGSLRAPERRDSGVPVASRAAAPEAKAPAPERERPAAAGGVAILASATRAQAVVAGVVSKPESIDVHGWRADLRVDRVLLGSLRLGDTVTIAWEELSAERQVRFDDEQRVLVVLDALPTQSLWRKRFPSRERARAVLVVASGGDAFLARPDGVTLDVLEHYLAMTPDARREAPGALRLAELVRGGQASVAREALALLEVEPSRAELLGADGAVVLLAAARSSEREPSLRGAALRLAARHRLPGTRDAALALSEPASPIRADAARALAALPDGLSSERVESLLGDADPELRAVGVEVGRDHLARERLLALTRSDPSPAVRLDAGQTLLARLGTGGIPDVIGLLDDPDAAVRTGMANGIGALGADAVAPLRAVIDGGSERAAFAAVLGLSRAGRKGGVTLAAIADTHENKAVRALARLALGEAPGHKH